MVINSLYEGLKTKKPTFRWVLLSTGLTAFDF